jgi:hypothetical protein
LAAAGFGPLGGHPELNDWFGSLTNWEGTPCCDGSDATRIEDVDWQTICGVGTGECQYQVRLEGKGGMYRQLQ